MLSFPTDITKIQERIQQISPEKYAKSRNYGNGAVTYLSPYISRGVISTKRVYAHIISLGLAWHKTEKLIQELAWRDYWQQVWMAKKDKINDDLRNPQQPIEHYELPKAISEARTGIQAVDTAIQQLYQKGYMHNHMRMYVASICCNIARAHWYLPAKWMYSHLLDGDLASNHLSWQWIAGTFSSKKYYANQDNINTFFNSSQKNTFLDVSYATLQNREVPEVLTETTSLTGVTTLPEVNASILDQHRTTLIYNYYNLDPYWYANQDVQRVLLLEPSFFRKYSVHKRCIDFVLALARNIKGIKLFVGEFAELRQRIHPENIVFKEHPTNSHYEGKEVPRDWISSVQGYFPSFFAYWKKCKKELQG